MVDEGSQYNDSNRAFLQVFLARSTLTFDEARPILAAILSVHEKRRCLPEDVSEAVFNSYITPANKAISAFDLEIRSTEHQTSGKRTYSLINSTDNPVTQLATSYSADEISYLNRVLDFMFETNNTPRREVMAITSMDAVRLAKAPAESSKQTQNGSATQGSIGQSLTMVQAQKMLDNLVVEDWLERSEKGYYSLSPRALMELRGWLVDTYNDDEDEEDERIMRIKMCFSCKGIITVGQRCPKQTCACRMHAICIEKFWRFQKSTKCPLCKTDWRESKNYVGERVLTITDELLRGKRRSGVNGVRSQGRKNRPVAVDDNDGVVDDEQADEDN